MSASEGTTVTTTGWESSYLTTEMGSIVRLREPDSQSEMAKPRQGVETKSYTVLTDSDTLYLRQRVPNQMGSELIGFQRGIYLHHHDDVGYPDRGNYHYRPIWIRLDKILTPHLI